MSDMYRKITLVILTIFVVSCAAPPKIVRHPAPADFTKDAFDLMAIPVFNPDSPDAFQVDLRSRDLTKLDLSSSTADLLYADFDSKTKWPVSSKMAPDFDWRKIMELNKDPGLGIRSLHDQGITGKGIGIAIIDQPLLVDHQEYRDQLQMYEEINILPDTAARMHGAAVASIAVGKTVGVASKADLYYIGAWTVDWTPDMKDYTWNLNYYAQAIHRLLEINRGLPEDRKIRVIAMQVGFKPNRIGYEEIMAAIDEAKTEGIFVISSSLAETYGLNFAGLGKTPLSNPNDFWSYRPGLWWQKSFYQQGLSSPTLLVPMDSRTTASPTGTEDYVYYRQGGWSWCIPYVAGTYALAAEVKPDITPEQFWEIALNTGKTIHIGHRGRDYKFGVILDPRALIEAIKSK